MKQFLPMVLCAVLLALAGCADVGVYPRVLEPTEIRYDAQTRLSDMRVYVAPRGGATQGLSALFMPLRVDTEMQYARTIGREVMRTFWQTWLSREVLPRQVYDDQLFYYGARSAIAEGRARGADLVVTGVLTHYFIGGPQSDTEVSLRIDIYETETGAMVWSMAQSGAIEFVRDENYILFVKTQQRRPDWESYLVVEDIARSMAVPVRDWSGGAAIAYTESERGGLYPDELPDRDAAYVPDPAPAETAPVIVPAVAASTEEMARTIETSEGDEAKGLNMAVEFDVDSAVIRPESRDDLVKLAEALRDQRFEGRSFLIRGHTDAQASEDYNLKLSRERAAAVKRFLVEEGRVEAPRILTQGFGEYDPIAPNDTPQGRQLNRRVEIRLAPKR